MADDGKVRIGTILDDSGFTSGLQKLGKIGSTALKGMSVGIGTAAAAVTGLTKLSTDAYASYEQLAGGVETLFKESAGTIIDYADNAYKAAGMSANKYMETVTGFSASLLQGLKGDTAAAAEYANKAVVDMSDNANKMGTSIELIQNAYQGFAKQNYTMLDNLKLGYGGTQAEMARLINDSGVLGDTMTVTAETVNQVSFDKIIEAIHVVQTEMGITGTTAKEASSTIEGSINTMKAQWENLMTALAGDDWDVGIYISNFVDSVIAVIENIAPRIKEILPNIADGIGMLFDQLGPYVSDAIEELLPALISGAISIAGKFAQKIPDIFNIVKNAIIQVFNEAMESAPQEVQDSINGLITAFQVLAPIVAGAVAAIEAYRAAMAITAIIDGVSKAITSFKKAQEASTIAQAALNAVMNMNPFVLIATLIAGVVAALVTLWMTNEDFRNAVIEIWGNVVSVISGVVDAIVGFFTETIPAVFNSVLDFFANNWQNILTFIANPFVGAFNLLYDNFEGFRNFVDNLYSTVKETASNIGKAVIDGINTAVDFITSLPEQALQWGKDFIQGFIDGITSMIDGLVGAVSDIADTVSSWLHFSRPDVGPLREYEKWMPDMMQGLADGITRNTWRVQKAVSGVSDMMATRGKAFSIADGNSDLSYGGNNGNVINIYGDVNDPDVFARKIRQQQRYGLAGAKA